MEKTSLNVHTWNFVRNDCLGLVSPLVSGVVIMSKKTRKTDTVIDDVMYKQLQHVGEDETYWKDVPKIPSGKIGSGLHMMKNKIQNNHMDNYDGNTVIAKKYLGEKAPGFRAVKLNLKNHGIFPAPSPDHITVLRGSDKSGGWISLEHYNKNRKRYRVQFGDVENPDVVVELFEDV